MGELEQNQTEETLNENTQPEEANQPPEEANSPERETPEAEAKAPAGEEAKPEVPEEETGEERRRRAGGWQRKIERLEREREAFRVQLDELRRGQQAAPEKPKDPDRQAEEYIANLVAQKLAAEREREQQARAQAEFQRRLSETRATHRDYDDVLESVSDVPVSATVQQALWTSEHGPALMYQLAKNPVELARISALPPLEAAREIGRLEARASVTPAPKAPVKTATRPPAPPTNVAGNSSSTRSLDELSISDYKRAYRSGRR